MKVKQSDGTEIEVFTEADVAARVTEAKGATAKEFETKIAESKTAIETALADKKKLEEQIAANGGGNQSENFKTLKAALDKKDEDIAKLRTDMMGIEEKRLTTARDQIVGKIAGTNKDLKDKILHHYSETLKSMPATNEEEMGKKVEAAAKLSLDKNASPDIIAAAIQGAGGPGLPINAGGSVEFTPMEKGLGNKLGISEEDFKKYGPRLKIKK